MAGNTSAGLKLEMLVAWRRNKSICEKILSIVTAVKKDMMSKLSCHFRAFSLNKSPLSASQYSSSFSAEL